MRRTNIFMNDSHLKQLGVIGKAQGLKKAQLVRIAVVEYLRRSARQAASAK
jgi:hypothetical protein